MSYVNVKVKGGLDWRNSGHGWQLRVHIAKAAITEMNDDNKIEIIKQCLQHVFNDDQVEIKVFEITGQQDEDGYDGAMSPNGKDRTQVGKEVCIYMPNANIEQLSSQEYKHRLLTLWQLFKANDVPLLHFNPPGDQSISIGSSGIPSPFSFTSQNPNHDEWKVKHGIVFKKFEAHGEHPILEVNFSIDDVNEYNLSLSDSLEQSVTFLTQHRAQAHDTIYSQLKLIDNQENFGYFLNGDEKTKILLKSLLAGYEEIMEKCASPEQRGIAQVKFREDLENNEDYQRLVNCYPHESDSGFSENPLINVIKTRINGNLLNENVDEIVNTLREQYQETIEGICVDFQEQEIEFDGYNVAQLVTKNPAAMQSVFRQQALINQEQSQNAVMNNNPLVVLLNNYRRERIQKTKGQYFSMFGSISRAFGGWSKGEKFSAVDALIDVLESEEETSLDICHIGPLQQGTLGKLIQSMDLDLDSMLQPTENSKLVI